MVRAIRFPISSEIVSSISKIGGLEAQLATYQKQLSDCVNCDSATMTEGKSLGQLCTNAGNAALRSQGRCQWRVRNVSLKKNFAWYAIHRT